MKKVIMGIGVPGSGKTTFLKDFATKNEYVYICPDDIRAELTGNVMDQSRNKDVWEEAYQRSAVTLADGKTLVFDATFADSRDRKRFIEHVRTAGAEKVQGVYLDVDLEVAKERNRERERNVPEHVIDTMHRKLATFPPDIIDGFDTIAYLNGDGSLREVEMSHENKKIHREFSKFQ